MTSIYPQSTVEISRRRRDLAPNQQARPLMPSARLSLPMERCRRRIWVAAETRAGGTYAHSALMIATAMETG